MSISTACHNLVIGFWQANIIRGTWEKSLESGDKQVGNTQFSIKGCKTEKLHLWFTFLTWLPQFHDGSNQVDLQ